MTAKSVATQTPDQSFFATEPQRQALARQRFFEDGVRPSGLVSESVIQSWSRCLQGRRDPRESPDFNVVTRSRIHGVLSRNRMLLEAAADELARLETTLAGTDCLAFLTDSHGVLVHATRSTATDDYVLPLAVRVGVNLAEEAVGTTAPGVVVRTGQPCTVRAGEHFFDCMQTLQCAAAPIRDIHQQVAGVLDMSIESKPFGFDAASIVVLHATSIENRLLQAQSHEHIVIRLQAMHSLLGTPLEGLAGVNSDGMLTWVNGAAARLLGVPQLAPWMSASTVFGLEPSVLAALTRKADASLHQLPNGLAIWLLARMKCADGADKVFSLRDPREDAKTPAQPEPAVPAAPTRASAASTSVVDAEPRRNEPTASECSDSVVTEPLGTARAATATLRDAEQQLVERTVAECGGNISIAARALGVSRGFIYRRLNRGRSADEGVAVPGTEDAASAL